MIKIFKIKQKQHKIQTVDKEYKLKIPKYTKLVYNFIQQTVNINIRFKLESLFSMYFVCVTNIWDVNKSQSKRESKHRCVQYIYTSVSCVNGK